MSKILSFNILLTLSGTLFGQNLDLPKFSHESGFYNSPFDLLLSHDNPEAKIIYTLDGSDPDINNLTGTTYLYKKQYPQFPGKLPDEYPFFENKYISNFYHNPIRIYNRTIEPNKLSNIPTTFQENQYFPNITLDKKFVVRAKAYLNNEWSETISKAYFVGNKKYTLPILMININEDKLFDYDIGLWVAGKNFDDWRVINPTDEAYGYTPANYWASGGKSEIEANIIYFDNKNEQLNQNIGIRNHGNGTRLLANRSFRFYAKSDYGKKSLDYSFFNNYDYNSFRRIILRNSGQDTRKTMFRDGFIQTLNSSLNFHIQKYQPTSIYVNGEYYGFFNIRERFDDKYFERVFNLKEDEIDFLENGGIVDLGDDIFYKETIDFFINSDLTDISKYNKALTYVDEINFTDYFIAEIFSSNFDWPQGNYEYFRKRVPYTPNSKYGHDGRWRWLFKDLDVAFNGDPSWLRDTYKLNMLIHAQENYIYEYKSENHIFKAFLKNEQFKQYFINRFADLMNTIYKPNHVIDLVDQIQNNIREEIPRQIERWNLIPSIEDWERNVEDLRIFAKERPKYQKQHILDYFKLDGLYNVTLENENKSKGFVKINSLEINNSTVGINDDYSNWTGEYFKGIPIKIEAVALPGYKFLKWEGDVESTEQVLTLNEGKNLKLKAIFGYDFLSKGDYERVDFLLFPNPVIDVLNIETRSNSEVKYKIFNILGQKIDEGKFVFQKLNLSHLNKGIYLIELQQEGKRTVKKIIK